MGYNFLKRKYSRFFSEDKNIDIVAKKHLVAFSLFPKLRANRRNNSQHCCANTVGSCCARVGSCVQTDYSNPDDHTEPIYELTTMLGPAVHHGKDTTLCKFEFDSLLAFVALTMLEELCIVGQQLPTLLDVICCIRSRRPGHNKIEFWS